MASMKPQVVTHALSVLLNSDATFPPIVAPLRLSARYIEMRMNMQFSPVARHNGERTAVQHKQARRRAYPDRQVVCVVGDGDRPMLTQRWPRS